MFKGRPVTGTVEGTGAAINVVLGFVPVAVFLINEDDPTWSIWTDTMTDAHMSKLTDAPAMTHPTSNGVTPYDGSATEGEGFTIGADTDMNVSGQTIHYLAFGAE